MSQTLPSLREEVARLEPNPAADATSISRVSGDGPKHTNHFVGLSTNQIKGAALQGHLVELAIPVYNEQAILESSVRRLRSYLDESFPFETLIRIVDNNSTDETWEIASRLAATLPGVAAMHLDQKGKGRAVRAAWSSSTARIVAYMDVDLSTDLDGLLPLVAPLLSGHSDIAIGTRLASSSRVLRGVRREVVSRAYHVVLRLALHSEFSDASCGFKAARRESVEALLPLVSDEHWFFDTELLVLAERNGFRIHEVPVDWIDDADSRVHIRSVARGDLRGIARLMLDRIAGHGDVEPEVSTVARIRTSQGARYAEVGFLSSVAYLTIFLLLRHPLGMYAANVVAFALSTIGSTIAHVRFTFGPKSGMNMRQAAMAASLAFLTGIALTTFALSVEEVIGVLSAVTEVLAILLGTAVAGFVRLILFRASSYRFYTQRSRS
jgi:glycosyltransferase involved in cell wall biosynthesis